MRVRLSMALAGLGALAMAAATAPALAADVDDQTTLLSLRLAGEDLAIEAGGAAKRLADRGGTVGTVPQPADFGFLGDPGAAVWALADPDGDLPAWDTVGVPVGRVRGDVAVELVDVAGPGDFHAYTVSSVGTPTLLLGTSDSAPVRAALPAGERRDELVWAFDAPGSYELTFTASVPLAGGGTATGTATHQVDVPQFSESATVAAGPLSASSGLAGASAAASTLQSQEESSGGERVVISDGHVDIGPRFVDDEWTIQVKDDTVSPTVWRDLADVVLHVVDDAAIEVPDGEFEFLGSPGDTVWMLPQAQQAGLLWPGWNTEDASVVSRISGNTTWRLRGVTAPGEFVLFLTGSFGQAQVLFNSREAMPQDMAIPPGTHAHGNWAFTESGVYHLEIEMSATTSDGDQVTDTRTLAFAVGDVDPNTAFPGGSGGNGGGNGGGDGDGNGGGGGDGKGGGMPKTGVTIAAIVAAGGALLGAGAVLIIRSRKSSGTDARAVEA